MRIRHLVRNVVVAGTVLSALVLTGGVSQAVEMPDLPLPSDGLPLPELPGTELPGLPGELPDIPSLPGVPDLPLPAGDLDNVPEPRSSDLPEAPETPDVPCSEPPSVEVDQSDVAFTTITISFVCESEKSFHKVISVKAAGQTILELDTQTVTASYGAHATTLRVPKATICVSDLTDDSEKCLP